MNLNKPLACLLAATTCVSSIPNIEAKDSKFEKAFNAIVNSKEALCAVGAFDLMAIISGSVLLSRQKKPTEFANSMKTLKFKFKNPQTGRVEVYESDYLIERTIPNSPIILMLPAPNFIDPDIRSQVLSNGELKNELNQLVTNINNPNATYKYLELEDSTPSDLGNSIQWEGRKPLDVGEYINQIINASTPIALISKRTSRKKRSVRTTNGNQQSTPQMPTYPVKKVKFKITDPQTGLEKIYTEGSQIYTGIPGSQTGIMLPNPINNSQAALFLNHVATDELKNELNQLVTNINNPNATYKYLELEDATPAQISNALQWFPQRSWDVDTYITELETAYNLHTPSYLNKRKKAQAAAAKQQAAAAKQQAAEQKQAQDTYDALHDMLSDGYDDGEPIRDGQNIHIVTVNGVDNCTYRAYQTGANDCYILPYPDCKVKNTALTPENNRKIYKLAMAIEKMTNLGELNNIVAQNDASVNEFSSTGNTANDVQNLKGISITLADGQNKFYCVNNLSLYGQHIVNNYTTKIKKRLVNTQQTPSCYFYQLSADSTRLEAFDDNKMNTYADQVGPNDIYLLPGKSSTEKHYLMAPKAEIAKFVIDGHLPNNDGLPDPTQYPRDPQATEKVLKIMLAKNYADPNKAMTGIDNKFSTATLITTMNEYGAWQAELARQKQAAAEAARKQAELDACIEKCKDAKFMETVRAYFIDAPTAPATPTGTPEPQEELPPEEMYASTIGDPIPTMDITRSIRGGVRGHGGHTSLVRARRNFFSMVGDDAARADGKLTNIQVKHSVNVDRLVVSPNITLADGNTLELRGKKCIKQNAASEEVQKAIQQLTTETASVTRLGNFLWDVGKHLDKSSVGVIELKFFTHKSPKRPQTSIKIAGNANKLGEMGCYIDPDYLLNGGFYDDWQKETFQKTFVAAAYTALHNGATRKEEASIKTQLQTRHSHDQNGARVTTVTIDGSKIIDSSKK